MSLDVQTLKLLTAKDQYIEARWLKARAFCYLSAAGAGYELLLSLDGKIRVAAEGVGSRLPYAGQFVAEDMAWLGIDGRLHRGDEALDLGSHASDLVAFEDGHLLISVASGNDELRYLSGADGGVLYRSSNHLRHLSAHAATRRALFLSWPRGELPWFSAELHLLDLDRPDRPEILHPPGLDTPCGEAEFSPSGDHIVASFLTGEFFQLWLYKIRTKNWVQLTVSEREHSTPLRRSSRRTFAFVREGLLVKSSSEKGFWRLDTLDYLGHGHKLTLPLSYIQGPRACPETGAVIALGASLDRPFGPYQLDAVQGGFVFASQEAPMPVEKALRVERISWSSVSGETIHGLLYRDASRQTPAPLILPVHGGPMDAVQATWPSKALAFVRQGYAVLYVNYRGSFGYGLSYLQALEGRFGQLEIKDLITGVRSLVDSGWVDPTRVGLWGGGVASHTVLRALSLYPEHFAAGVAVFPILDMASHIEKTSEPERAELTWALGTESADDLQRLSARVALAKLERPLAVFAGGKDRLCDHDGLASLQDELKQRRVPCWLTVYEDEGRSFRNDETYSDYYSKVAGFFDRFLKFRS